MVKNRLEKGVKDSEIVCLCTDGHQNFTQRVTKKKNGTEKSNREEKVTQFCDLCFNSFCSKSPKERSDGSCEVIFVSKSHRAADKRKGKRKTKRVLEKCLLKND